MALRVSLNRQGIELAGLAQENERLRAREQESGVHAPASGRERRPSAESSGRERRPSAESQQARGPDHEISELSEIHDALEVHTPSVDSLMLERQRRQSQESELTELRSASEIQNGIIRTLRRENERLDIQEQEVRQLRSALELQTANVDTLLRESRRLQALEGELADLRTARGTKDAGQGTDSVGTEEAWSLTSPSGSSPAGGPGLESTSPPDSSAQSLVAPGSEALAAAAPAGAAGARRRSGCEAQLWAEPEEPWRLVRAILGVLDTMQQRLGSGSQKPQLGPEWRSLVSVDIRILVGMGPADAGLLGKCQGGEQEQGERTFMYVLI